MIRLRQKISSIRYSEQKLSKNLKKYASTKPYNSEYMSSVLRYGVNDLELPVFQTSAKNIQILTDPIEYYSALLVIIFVSQ